MLGIMLLPFKIIFKFNFLFVMRTLKISPLSEFQVYNKLPTVVAVLDVRSIEIIYNRTFVCHMLISL